MCFGSPKISDKQLGNCKCAEHTYACVLACVYGGCRCMFREHCSPSILIGTSFDFENLDKKFGHLF